MRIKDMPTYNVILWDINHDQIEYYDIIPYLVESWKDEKNRRHKIWDYDHKFSKDDTRMPETFDEFRYFVKMNSQYRFWSRCEYEIIVCGWPKSKKETKIDAYDQIMQNIDIVTGLFINHVTKNSRNHKLTTR